jgi:hypothetical protein
MRDREGRQPLATTDWRPRIFPLVFAKVAKVANFCTRGVGDLVGQKPVSKDPTDYTRAPFAGDFQAERYGRGRNAASGKVFRWFSIMRFTKMATESIKSGPFEADWLFCEPLSAAFRPLSAPPRVAGAYFTV